MSDWIEKDGKRYFEKGYFEMANATAKRRGERIKALEKALREHRKLLQAARIAIGRLHGMTNDEGDLIDDIDGLLGPAPESDNG